MTAQSSSINQPTTTTIASDEADSNTECTTNRLRCKTPSGLDDYKDAEDEEIFTSNNADEEDDGEDDEYEEDECHLLLIGDGKLALDEDQLRHRPEKRSSKSTNSKLNKKRMSSASSIRRQVSPTGARERQQQDAPTTISHHHGTSLSWRKLISYLGGAKLSALWAQETQDDVESSDDWCEDFVYSPAAGGWSLPVADSNEQQHYDRRNNSNNKINQTNLDKDHPTRLPTSTDYYKHHHHHHHTQTNFLAKPRVLMRKFSWRQLLALCNLLALILVLVALGLVALTLAVKVLTLFGQLKQQYSSNSTPVWQLNDLDEQHRRQYESGQSARWLVSTSKCRIPALKPWDSSISSHVHRAKPLDCSAILKSAEQKKMADGQRQGDLASSTESNSWPSANTPTTTRRQTKRATLSFVRSNRLHFTQEALSLGARWLDDCCYREITRSEDNDDDLVYGKQCLLIGAALLTGDGGVEFENGSQLIEINCKKLNYTNVHSFVLSTNNSSIEEEREALAQVASRKLIKDNYYNILMLGVDTMSRLNGLRQLNATLGVLDKLYHKLDFVGYNKVGENTFPNLIPLLTGLKPDQLTHAAIQCWQAPDRSNESESGAGDDYLDNCKYLWNFYQQLGYSTYYSEDWPAASTFNYIKRGFKREPTTYYGRPFTLARHKLEYPPVGMGCTQCLLDEPIVKIDLDNLRQFVLANQRQPYFAFHWVNCPQHDDLDGASQVDGLFVDFFEQLRPILAQDERTFVIFFSDHGYRWQPFVSTRIGHYESSLPMLSIAPPRKFIEQHPDLYNNMKQHQSVLLTPFDMFKTMIDIRNLGASDAAINTRRAAKPSQPNDQHLDNISAFASSLINFDSNNSISDSSSQADHLASSSSSARQYSERESPTAATTIKQVTILDGLSFKQNFKILSLLDEHNSSQVDRSCSEAGIPDNYCVCQSFSQLDPQAPDVLGSAYYLVYIHLGDKLQDHKQLCHLLDLDSIHHAELHSFESSQQQQAAANSSTTETSPTTSSHQTAELWSSSSSLIDKPTDSQPVTQRLAPAAAERLPRVRHLQTTTTTTTTQSPGQREQQQQELDELTNALPRREYNIVVSTKPGAGLFQEVVRYYGANLDLCLRAVELTKRLVGDYLATYQDKRASVSQMNSICRFSVHSESISRLNLYKDQSKCVRSNIELKKICNCV